MFFKTVDKSATKHEIQGALLEIASENGQPLSDARALNLAAKFKKGIFDPDLMRVLQYSDITGETAVKNAMKVAA